MALKIDWQYSFNEEGELLLGDMSYVACSEEDPCSLHAFDEVSSPRHRPEDMQEILE